MLSTLHTNDAPSAVTRLTEMGIEPFLVGSALDCVLAQRLARRLCGRCKEPYLPTAEELLSAGYPWIPGEELPELHRPVGLLRVRQDRLQGAAGAARGDDRDRGDRAAGGGASLGQRRSPRWPAQQGCESLREDGHEKVRRGLTSIEEILRVVGVSVLAVQ